MAKLQSRFFLGMAFSQILWRSLYFFEPHYSLSLNGVVYSSRYTDSFEFSQVLHIDWLCYTQGNYEM